MKSVYKGLSVLLIAASLSLLIIYATKGPVIAPVIGSANSTGNKAIDEATETADNKLIDSSGQSIIPSKFLPIILSKPMPETNAFNPYTTALLPLSRPFAPRFQILLAPCLKDIPVDYYDGIILLQRGDKFGYADYRGNYLTEIKYDEAELFCEGLARVKLQDKYGFIDLTGREVIPLQYDRADRFDNGVAVVSQNGKKGVINTKGEVIVPLRYLHLFCNGDGNALTGTNIETDDDLGFRTVWGFNFYEAGVELPCQYQTTSNLSDGFYSVYKDEKWALLDSSGNLLTDYQYDYIGSFSYGLASVRLDDKWGYLDTNGKEAIPLQYDTAYLFCYGRAVVSRDGKWGYIDRNGTAVTPLQYDFACNFYNGLAGVIVNQKYGMIDYYGNLCIPIEYDWLSAFHDDGRITAMRDGKLGFLDGTGKEIIPFIYDHAYDFDDGYAKVELDGKTGYLDRNGAVVTPLIYDDPYGDKEDHISSYYSRRPIGEDEFEVPLTPDLNLRTKDTGHGMRNKTGLNPTGRDWQVTGFFDNQGNELISPGYGDEIKAVYFEKYYHWPIDTNLYGKEAVFSYRVDDRYGLFTIADDRIPRLIVYAGESQTDLYSLSLDFLPSEMLGQVVLLSEGNEDGKIALDENLTLREEQYLSGELRTTHTVGLPQFVTTGKNDPLAEINSFYQEYAEEIRQVIKENMTIPVNENFRFYYDVSSKIKVTPRFINVILREEGFFGGFHPNISVLSHVFNRATGERVSLGELFSVNEDIWRPRLCEGADRAIREGFDYQDRYPHIPQNAATYAEERQGVYEIYDRVIGNDNFYLDTDGIVLIFNTYTLTSYHFGPTWVKVPFTDLADILRVDY